MRYDLGRFRRPMRRSTETQLLSLIGLGDGSTLSLDFTAMTSLDSRFTFTRSSTATFINSSGLVQFANANLMTYSTPRSAGSAWGVVGTVTWGSATITDPVGNSSAQEVTFGTAGSAIFNTTGTTVTNGITHTFSVWMRAATGTTNVRIGNANVGAVSTVSLTTTWQRFSCQYVSSGTNDGGAIYSQTGTPSATFYVWGAQVQPGSVVGELLETTGTIRRDIPRFDYDPTTLAPRGLLIEGSATNSLQRSEEFNLSPWSAFSATITANDGVAPDGNTTADSITPSVASGGTFYNSSFAAGTWTFSIWAKANPGSSFNISVDTSSNGRACTYTLTSGGSAGTPFVRGTGGTVTSFSASTQTFQNGWVRCVATVVTTGSNFVAITNPTDTNKILIWGAQLEAGSGASSYIPTGASTVQRAADVCTMSGTNFSSWFNSTAGTFLATGERAITSDFGRLLSANANNTTSAFDLGASTTGRWLITNTTSQADITAGTVTANTAFKVAGAFANNDAQMAFNGTLGTADTSVSLPTVSQLDIGADRTAVYLNGRIRSNKFWPTRMPNATLQSLTQ